MQNKKNQINLNSNQLKGNKIDQNYHVNKINFGIVVYEWIYLVKNGLFAQLSILNDNSEFSKTMLLETKEIADCVGAILGCI